jgi:UDP-3-O-[3-hydroxymyristoyl] N-acetylglucosamine deacetylase/3-hydroxyacyl-[acyl-carrier-protein] dehydratase
MSQNQKTIQEIAEFEGAGLFSGEEVKLRFIPATPGTGITFVRTDLSEDPKIRACPENASSKFRRTTVSDGDAQVETIEHLMASIGGLGIDNLEIEINGPEVPAADGSAKPFVELLSNAGVVEQDSEREEFEINEPVTVREDGSSITVVPEDERMEVSYSLEYPHPIIGSQHMTTEVNEERFSSDIAPARTFCLEEEVDNFLDKGLGKGASYDNTIVVGDNGVVDNELRFDDEFVRHKILDFIGDISLLGTKLDAHYVAVRSGHEINIQLVKKLDRVIRGGATPQEQEGEEGDSHVALDMQEILNVLPHRYPFLLIDRVLELEGYDRAVGLKNVSYNEPFFQGHFPDKPIMPGVLQIEAMAQLSGALLLRKAENVNKLAFLMSLDDVKLRKTVVPGDQLRIEANAVKVKSRTGLIEAKATVEGRLAAEAKLKFMLVPKE